MRWLEARRSTAAKRVDESFDPVRNRWMDRSKLHIAAAPTVRYDVFMAGDLAEARRFCRRFVFEVGLCVHLEAVDYVYKGGEEAGFKVGLINYPRFPKEDREIRAQAEELGLRLMEELCQESFCVVGPAETTWYSRRAADLKPAA
jgi:hypothetical protein